MKRKIFTEEESGINYTITQRLNVYKISILYGDYGDEKIGIIELATMFTKLSGIIKNTSGRISIETKVMKVTKCPRIVEFSNRKFSYKEFMSALRKIHKEAIHIIENQDEL